MFMKHLSQRRGCHLSANRYFLDTLYGPLGKLEKMPSSILSTGREPSRLKEIMRPLSNDLIEMRSDESDDGEKVARSRGYSIPDT